MSSERMTYEQASAYLGVKKSTLYRYKFKGIISCHEQPGVRPYFLKSELDDWMRGGRTLTNQEIAQRAKQVQPIKRMF